MRFTLEDLKNATNAEIKGEVEGSFEISTDTRTIKKGDMKNGKFKKQLSCCTIK